MSFVLPTTGSLISRPASLASNHAVSAKTAPGSRSSFAPKCFFHVWISQIIQQLFKILPKICLLSFPFIYSNSESYRKDRLEATTGTKLWVQRKQTNHTGKKTRHVNDFVHHTFRKPRIILGEFRSDQQKISRFKRESYQEASEKLVSEVAARKTACGT